MKKKLISLLIVTILFSVCATAQVRTVLDQVPSLFEISAGFGRTQIYGDLNKHKPGNAYFAAFDKNSPIKHIKTIFKVEHGDLISEETKNQWTDGLHSHCQYNSAETDWTFYVDAIIPHGWAASLTPYEHLMKSIYVGTGAGVINCNVTLDDKFKPTDAHKINNFQKNATAPYIAEIIGFDVQIPEYWNWPIHGYFNVHYTFNETSSDYIDGYNFQHQKNNKFNDMYSVLYMSFIVKVGGK